MRRLQEDGASFKDKEGEEKKESFKMFEKSKEVVTLLSEGALVESTIRTYK
jgi:hypothetical protein